MTINKKLFSGIDASKEISLLEYGLLVYGEKNEDGSGTQFCVYKIDEDAYGTGHYSEDEINTLLDGKDWIDEKEVNEFLSYTGSTKDEFLSSSFANKLFDLKQYFGYENIFGTDYMPLTEEEAINLYL